MTEQKHALLSASSSARWLACPPSAVAAAAYPETDTEFTKEGTLAHSVAEAIASNKNLPENEQRDGIADGIDQEMVNCGLDYRDLIAENITTPDAIVLLEQRVDFSPWVPGGFGTCDCIIIQGDTLTIIDYKYGKGVPVSAVENPQMRLYALGALNDYGIALDVTTVKMIIHQPRLDSITTDSLTVDELLDWAVHTVKPIAEDAAQGKGEYKPGEHCRFCPHTGRCRELTKVCTEYVNTHGINAEVPILAPYEVAEVLYMEPLITLWLKKVKAQALADMLEGKEVPGYKVVEGKLGNRKWKDEVATYEELRRYGYPQEDITETKLLSPAAMDKYLGKKKAAELLTEFIERAPGAPTIVPVTDKRQAYDRTADFENLDK